MKKKTTIPFYFHILIIFFLNLISRTQLYIACGIHNANTTKLFQLGVFFSALNDGIVFYIMNKCVRLFAINGE